MSVILVTGCAGFIGYHVAERLLSHGDSVLGVDSLNDYYDPELKRARLRRLQRHEHFRFVHVDITDGPMLASLFAQERFARVVHLAAQAGVRYSLQNPGAYVQANVVGFLNILEGCRHNRVEHLVYASSSSVYGANRTLPYAVHQNVDHPVSLYAATKKADELMAHAYSHLFDLPVTGLRFFTVYGPWGRPDMAYYKFAKAIVTGRPIELYNQGHMRRDFTYIDDIVEGVVRVLDRLPTPNPMWSAAAPNPGSSYAPYRLYNIGNHTPVELLEMVQLLEEALGREAVKVYVDMQPGDVLETFADVTELRRDTGFEPSTALGVGLRLFTNWFLDFHPELRP